ncbi:ROK family protein [Metabacillus sp. GX 13764]|uniref:ROK family protein n=1 Tax=Metabacillus kandeliae TaxID=2900151 RepID=UPI001E4BF380|nr:ROK family protein [Metabacillus kandeliae]MCD7035060.1 ROK family protein [Metabacillus kandeliae]
MSNYLCFDIGGTDVKYATADKEGNLLNPGVFSSENGSGKAVLNGIERLAAAEKELAGVAVSAPGFVHPETGFLEKGGAIEEFHGFPLKDYLEEKLSVPVTVENDVNCAALGEKWRGNARHDENFLCLTIGTGIGGAIFFQNRLYRGHSFRAGEFGYMITNGVGAATPEGSTMNSFATVYSLRKQYAQMKKRSFQDVSGLEVFEAYDHGDYAAKGLVRKFFSNIAICLYNLSYILNPGKILIGGAISSRPTLLQELKEELAYLAQDGSGPLLDVCALKNQAGLTGALYYHLHGDQEFIAGDAT